MSGTGPSEPALRMPSQRNVQQPNGNPLVNQEIFSNMVEATVAVDGCGRKYNMLPLPALARWHELASRASDTVEGLAGEATWLRRQ